MAPLTLCLAGPTASGKTAAAMALARVLPLEIVSVDSALVYRGMDIGTAKPSAAERAAVPHHLIDVIDPTEAWSAAQFVAAAHRLIGEIRARGRQPLLVGGTMLYFKALFDGLDALPAADPALRAALDAEARERGWPALHAELARVDPVTAARLAPMDAQRIQRALEVWRGTGQMLSSLHSGRFGGPTGIPEDMALISLEPTDRPWLHARIAERFDAMLAAGFLDEVRALRARGDLHADLPSMRCVGYRQAWQEGEALGGDGALHTAAPTTLPGLSTAPRSGPSARRFEAFRAAGIAATRQLAKRQLTWLRSMPGRIVVACDQEDAAQQVVARAQALLAQAGEAAHA
jgi:tRNA dimethylallyltransferase